MARLFADENFARQVVEALRQLGHDVLTATEAGLGGRGVPDPIILEHAAADGRAVLTLNRRDFVRLHMARPDHAGIIACTYDADFVGQAERIAALLASTPDLRGQLLRVNRPGPAAAPPDS